MFGDNVKPFRCTKKRPVPEKKMPPWEALLREQSKEYIHLQLWFTSKLQNPCTALTVSSYTEAEEREQQFGYDEWLLQAPKHAIYFHELKHHHRLMITQCRAAAAARYSFKVKHNNERLWTLLSHTTTTTAAPAAEAFVTCECAWLSGDEWHNFFLKREERMEHTDFFSIFSQLPSRKECKIKKNWSWVNSSSFVLCSLGFP